MAVRRIPLLPHAGIYLEAFGHADDAYFGRAFRHTWRRLPRDVRKDLLAHWRRFAFLGRPVKIEVLPDWSTRTSGACGEVLVHERGDGAPLWEEIRFWAPVVRLAPRDVLTALIVHELAHCYQNANGGVREWGNSDATGDVSPVAPEEADPVIEWTAGDLVSDWGFEDEDISKGMWYEEHEAELMAYDAAAAT